MVLDLRMYICTPLSSQAAAVTQERDCSVREGGGGEAEAGASPGSASGSAIGVELVGREGSIMQDYSNVREFDLGDGWLIVPFIPTEMFRQAISAFEVQGVRARED